MKRRAPQRHPARSEKAGAGLADSAPKTNYRPWSTFRWDVKAKILTLPNFLPGRPRGLWLWKGAREASPAAVGAASWAQWARAARALKSAKRRDSSPGVAQACGRLHGGRRAQGGFPGEEGECGSDAPTAGPRCFSLSGDRRARTRVPIPNPRGGIGCLGPCCAELQVGGNSGVHGGWTLAPRRSKAFQRKEGPRQGSRLLSAEWSRAAGPKWES